MNPEILQKLHNLKLRLDDGLKAPPPDGQIHGFHKATVYKQDLEVLQSAIDIIDLFANMGRISK